MTQVIIKNDGVGERMPLSENEFGLTNAYWRAANYLSVGQIYLLANPLLREPLQPEHVKPRLLGHWGTTPGINFIYTHMNRVIRNWDLDAVYVIGPGHGGPAAVANAYLEGTYSEVYPHITRDEDGMAKLFRQFSFPGGIPSHVAPETPGSLHEGGELGYALSHAYGAAFDNPNLLVCCIVGDGEAETGPLATSWHSNKFLNPVSDGAVLPVLHLNGYKIANPTVLARIGDDELTSLLEGYGYEVNWVSGDDPAEMHQLMAATLDKVVERITSIQRFARSWRCDKTEVAHDRAPIAEGLDRPRDRGRAAVRGYVAVAPGAICRGTHEPRAPGAARVVDAQLPPGRAVRRKRGPGGRIGGPPAQEPPPYERQPAFQRRVVAARFGTTRFLRLRRAGSQARDDLRRGHQSGGRVPPGHHDG